jgi:hypothetical protein
MFVQAILFEFNVQHDRYEAGCKASGIRQVQQERESTNLTESVIIHNPLERYIINLAAFHHAHLVRHMLVRDLWAPVPRFSSEHERRLFHDDLAATLQTD